MSLDARTTRMLRQALALSEQASALSCGFWACPGPDKPFVNMATCYVCSTTQVLRRAVRQIDNPHGSRGATRLAVASQTPRGRNDGR